MMTRLLLGLTLFASGVFGCSCLTTGLVCSNFLKATVVFVGKVLRGNDNGKGNFTHYLVEVEEAFRGLKPEQKEVFIDPDITPGMITSCHQAYEVGKQYLFFGYVNEKTPTLAAQFKRIGYPPGNLTPEWKKKLDLKVYSTGICSGSKPLDRAEADLPWLRLAVKGKVRDSMGTWCELPVR